MTRPIRTLLFSTLYPSAARPVHGVFVETRLRELLRSGEVQTCVVAPVPWFPWTGERWGGYGRMASTPLRESRYGIEVLHPRFVAAPKVGMSIAPIALAQAGLRAAYRLRREGFDFDVIDAHYFYPDGVAAALMSCALGRPFTVTARGTDLNLIATYAIPRRWMRWAASKAGRCVGVSQALVGRMAELGMPRDRLQLIRNGVDLTVFRPLPAAQARADIGFEGSPLLLSVGNLIPSKGHDICIEALAHLLPRYPAGRLLIIGAGVQRASLESLAREHGLAGRVHFVGQVPHGELVDWYSAADLLLLASSREGWPNVLLESLACGTPVIATNVGGIPEVVAERCAGQLIASRKPAVLAEAIEAALREGTDRAAARAHAERFGWEPTTAAQIEMFASLLGATVAQAALP